MPLRKIATGFGLALSLVSRAALADLPKCPRHGPLRTIVAPSEHDPTLARRTLDQVFSELAERTRACPASEQRPIELEVEWRPSQHVLVRVTMETRVREISLERDVDLARVPADGVPLAVAIVADEMLAEIYDRVAADETARAPKVHAEPVRASLPPAPRPPERALRFGLSGAFQQLTSGLSLSGLDVDATWLATPHFQVGLRAGLRAVAWVGAPSYEGEGWAAGAFALASTSALSARGVAAMTALDVLALGATARVSPAAGVYAWQRLGERFVLHAEARLGGVLSTASEFSALSGACVTLALGIATEW